MTLNHIINVDLAQVSTTRDRDHFVTTLSWGDEVEVLDIKGNCVEIALAKFVKQSKIGLAVVLPPAPLAASAPLASALYEKILRLHFLRGFHFWAVRMITDRSREISGE